MRRVLIKYFILILSKIPLFILFKISRILYFITYYILKYRKNIVYNNLLRSFPKKDNSQIINIQKNSIKHFCDLIIEIIYSFSISKNELIKRVKIKNEKIFKEIDSNVNGSILIGAHYNNWEWMGLLLSIYFSKKINFAYKPLSNKILNEILLQSRKRFNGNPINMKDFARVTLEDSKNLSVFLCDQSPRKKEINFFCDFLNQKTPVYIGPEKISIKKKQDIYFIILKKLTRGYYEIDLKKIKKNNLNFGEITKLHVKELEKLILDNPNHWLWTHRRWKFQKKI